MDFIRQRDDRVAAWPDVLKLLSVDFLLLQKMLLIAADEVIRAVYRCTNESEVVTILKEWPSYRRNYEVVALVKMLFSRGCLHLLQEPITGGWYIDTFSLLDPRIATIEILDGGLRRATIVGTHVTITLHHLYFLENVILSLAEEPGLPFDVPHWIPAENLQKWRELAYLVNPEYFAGNDVRKSCFPKVNDIPATVQIRHKSWLAASEK